MAITAIVGLLTLLPFALIILVRIALFLLGRYLILQSRERRDILRALFKRDLDLGPHDNVTSVDNGWEKVETPPQSQQNAWTGVIGFFHPFW